MWTKKAHLLVGDSSQKSHPFFVASRWLLAGSGCLTAQNVPVCVSLSAWPQPKEEFHSYFRL